MIVPQTIIKVYHTTYKIENFMLVSHQNYPEIVISCYEIH